MIQLILSIVLVLAAPLSQAWAQSSQTFTLEVKSLDSDGQARRQIITKTHEELVQSFQDAALYNIRELIAQGHKNLGSIDLSALENKIMQIPVEFVESVSIDSTDGVRTGGRWQRNSKESSIEISARNWMLSTSELQRTVAAHDSMGALNLNDDDYQLTVAMQWLAQAPTSVDSEFIRWDELQALPQHSTQALEGGVIGVGGGGDFDAGGIKARLMGLVLRAEEMNSWFDADATMIAVIQTFITHLLMARFEATAREQSHSTAATISDFSIEDTGTFLVKTPRYLQSIFDDPNRADQILSRILNDFYELFRQKVNDGTITVNFK